MPPSLESNDNSRTKKSGLKRKASSSSSEDFFDMIEFPSGRPPNRPIVPIMATVNRGRKPLPTRDNSSGSLFFADFPEFRPNLTPKEVIQLGSFGGTYFQPITSGVTGESYRDVWREFPSDWFEGVDIDRMVASLTYSAEVNMYKVACGGGLKEWEESGWICNLDPYGWFQWYCRFYLGRRCSDDYRQITRALGVMGPTGRWKKNLLNKCVSAIGRTDHQGNNSATLGLGISDLISQQESVLRDYSISPKIRQLLQDVQDHMHT
eukprot:gene36221-43936_t